MVWPFALLPQPTIVPLLRRANAWAAPASMRCVVTPAGRSGAGIRIRPGSPHATTVPFARLASTPYAVASTSAKVSEYHSLSYQLCPQPKSRVWACEGAASAARAQAASTEYRCQNHRMLCLDSLRMGRLLSRDGHVQRSTEYGFRSAPVDPGWREIGHVGNSAARGRKRTAESEGGFGEEIRPAISRIRWARHSHSE